jgi:hypothetical protein
VHFLVLWWRCVFLQVVLVLLFAVLFMVGILQTLFYTVLLHNPRGYDPIRGYPP